MNLKYVHIFEMNNLSSYRNKEERYYQITKNQRLYASSFNQTSFATVYCRNLHICYFNGAGILYIN